MGYWVWYVLIALLAWAFRLPWLALLALAVVVARRRLADPVEWLRTVRTVRALQARIAALPGDVLARRNLARIYLGKHRARAACALLEEAIAKGLCDAEAFYLLGLARTRAGDPAGALEPLVKCVAIHERFMLGEPYFTAAAALVALGRLDEAEDALERGLAINASRVDGHVRLGRVRARRGDAGGARAAFRAGEQAWLASPDFLRWRCVGSFARAWWGARRG